MATVTHITDSSISLSAQNWDSVYTNVRANSASWEESAEIIPTVTNYLSTNNVLVSSLNVLGNVLIQNNGGLTVSGNISGSNFRTSFNTGSATGNWSFAVNKGLASGNFSHAEGAFTIASGSFSHAEGYLTTASEENSHAEGAFTIASGFASHAEGSGIASGDRSHSEGVSTRASGGASHAEGNSTRARGSTSHAAGTRSEAAHDRTWIWKGSTATAYVSTTRADQFMVSAAGGAAFFGNVGINTDSIANPLTVVGNISGTSIIYANNGNSNLWNSASNISTVFQSTSASFATTTLLNSISSSIIDYINKNFIGLINPQP